MELNRVVIAFSLTISGPKTAARSEITQDDPVLMVMLNRVFLLLSWGLLWRIMVELHWRWMLK